MSIFRCTGVVEAVDVRRGNAKATGAAYEIPYVVVKINDFASNELTLADALVGKLQPGDNVDLIVDVTRNQSGYMNARATGAWPGSSLPDRSARPASPLRPAAGGA